MMRYAEKGGVVLADTDVDITHLFTLSVNRGTPMRACG